MVTVQKVQQWQEQLKAAIMANNWNLADALVKKINSAKENLPNTACTRLETGAAKSDSESNPAVSSG